MKTQKKLAAVAAMLLAAQAHAMNPKKETSILSSHLDIDKKISSNPPPFVPFENSPPELTATPGEMTLASVVSCDGLSFFYDGSYDLSPGCN